MLRLEWAPNPTITSFRFCSKFLTILEWPLYFLHDCIACCHYRVMTSSHTQTFKTVCRSLNSQAIQTLHARSLIFERVAHRSCVHQSSQSVGQRKFALNSTGWNSQLENSWKSQLRRSSMQVSASLATPALELGGRSSWKKFEITS